MSLGNSNGGVGFRNRNRRVDPSSVTVNTGTPAADAKVGKVDPVTGGKGVDGGKTPKDTRSALARAGRVPGTTALNPDMYGDTSLLKKPGYGVGPLGNVVHVATRPSESSTSKTLKPKVKKSKVTDTLAPTPTTTPAGI